MNKLLVSALIASTSLAIVTTKKATDAEYDRAQIKEDVRLLMNDIDEYGDIDDNMKVKFFIEDNSVSDIKAIGDISLEANA